MKLLLISLALIATASAQEISPAELKLREQLRSTALLLRAAETEKANALATFAAEQAKTMALQKEIDDLNGKLTTQTKRSSEDKLASEQAIAELNDKIIGRESRLKEFSAALEKWKAAYQKAAQTAQTKESERADLANEKLTLKNTVADRERKNLNLYKTSLDILDRYENYALGKALSAREPFIQKTRVTIENQVQSYKDSIIDNRISAPSKP
ncbi:MAG: phage major capsid protein [Armatimonadetes bacterium]|nr:phage major capsid protein [Akkermansiaceae bacterium]